MKLLRYALAFSFLLVATATAFAGGVPGDGGDGGGGTVNDVPIDGGASLLVAAAAAYGYKKMKKNKTADISDK